MRKLDETIEKEVGQFMDTYFYAKLNKPYVRNTDKQLQYRGCDLSVGNSIIDEKVKYNNCLNATIDCPSVEILTKNRYGVYMDGWFVKENQITDKYAFISIGTNQTDYSKITYNTINDLTVLFVDKKELTDWVEEELSLSGLMKDAEYLRDSTETTYKQRKHYPHRKFWLTYSPNLKEQPVNLVMPRASMKNLSKSFEVKITKSKIEKI